MTRGTIRLAWEQLPLSIRRAVAGCLRCEITEAHSRDSGYSDAAAAMVRLSNGGTAFVKSVDGPEARRRGLEASVVSSLPPGTPVPRLLDVLDDGQWVTLVYEAIDGRHPAIPWKQAELNRVASAIGELAGTLDPSPWRAAPDFEKGNIRFMNGRRELAPACPPELHPSHHRLLERMCEGESISPGSALARP